ncbi:MAG: NfeD family protein [Sphingomonas sp.]|uniref:NfeD family protein n=1 Tax=Sphingomonas sp. TaxID=28214 RepID=UPI003F80B025
MLAWLEQGATAWLVAALVLGVAELIAPGFFLIFLALGAGITGFVLLALPDQPILVQAAIFAIASGVAAAIGYRWYRTSAPSEDPLLNDRAARLIGEVVTVTEAISASSGRVKVGDGAWPARGPDAPLGAKVRVVGESSGELLVEPA